MSKLNVDTSKWVKGKNFPEWMDEIGTSLSHKDTYSQMKMYLKHLIE
jgi:hypothetical protein